jgi:hypothetical protein
VNAPTIGSDEMRVILRGQLRLIINRLEAGIPTSSALLNAAWLAERIERAGRPVKNGRPTLDEVASAMPKRGTGAPVRTRSHYDAILELLRERGPQGVLASELYGSPEKYGRSPRNRISELRQDGHLIEGKPRGSSDWFYRLIRDSDGEKPQPTESAFMQLRRKEQDEAAPLFKGVA